MTEDGSSDAVLAGGAPLRQERDRLAAFELGLSDSRLNSKIRLVNHRGYSHHSAGAVMSMIYLCCGEISIRERQRGSRRPSG